MFINSHGHTNELEKRIVVCNSKEKNDFLRSGERKGHGCRRGGGFLALKRSPLQDIGNSSSLLMKQNNNGKVVFPLRWHLSSDV